MKKLILTTAAIATVSLISNCTSKPKDMEPTQIADGIQVPHSPPAQEEVYLIQGVYSGSKEFNAKHSKLEITSERKWRGYAGRRKNTYLEKLKTFALATSTQSSKSGKIHDVCFVGPADQALAAFFGLRTANEANQSGAKISNYRYSTDNYAMSFSLQLPGITKTSIVTIRSCFEPGKNLLIDPELVNQAIANYKKTVPPGMKNDFARDTLDAVASSPDLSIDDVRSKGFGIADSAPRTQDLPVFAVKSDYAKAVNAKDIFPWRSIDMSTAEGKKHFAAVMKDYAYDGMMNQNKSNSDMNFIATNDRHGRFFCHMPWLNTGNTGREFVHGLTKERDLQVSDIYPNAKTGADYGTAIFNGTGCKAIGAVFGDGQSPKLVPEWKNAKFENGTVIVKVLFTTAKFEAINDAFKWKANVSEAGSRNRKIQTVSHIQMDIAVKDNFKGLKAESDDWVMLTYYFDANYTPNNFEMSLMKEDGLPTSLMKMRPLGLQWGFTKSESEIFDGLKTNNKEGHLNGPADNKKANCMACHGTAGTKLDMVPGITSTVQWNDVKNEALDVNQQFALAKRNFETAQPSSPKSGK